MKPIGSDGVNKHSHTGHISNKAFDQLCKLRDKVVDFANDLEGDAFKGLNSIALTMTGRSVGRIGSHSKMANHTSKASKTPIHNNSDLPRMRH